MSTHALFPLANRLEDAALQREDLVDVIGDVTHLDAAPLSLRSLVERALKLMNAKMRRGRTKWKLDLQNLISKIVHL